MGFSLYGDDAKGLIRLDPRTKLLVLLSGVILSLNNYNALPLIAVCTSLCILLALCGKPWTALKALTAFAVCMYLRWCISGGAAVVVAILQTLITAFLFCFPIIIGFALLIGTTRISHFLSAFQAMRLPLRVIIPIAVFFRFIPTVQDEWAGIRKAMAFRGVSLGLGSVLRHPFKTVEYVLIPLLFSSISVMEELASSAMARGMDADTRRSSYEEVRFGAADYVVLAAFAALIVIVFALGGV